MKKTDILKKLRNKSPAVIVVAFIFLIWQVLTSFEFVPEFMFPSPVSVFKVLIEDFNLLLVNSLTTFCEAFVGLIIGILVGFLVAFLMDRFKLLKKAVYPILIISQTVPTVAIAPILILFLGYGSLPKVTLVALCCFFPVAVNFLTGFNSPSIEYINLLKTMGSSKMQIFKHIKLPFALKFFFSGLKISVSYAFVTAVVSEWLGGVAGLGVYMIRAKKSYAFDRMFAVIILICLISFVLVKCTEAFEKVMLPWERNLLKK